MLEVADVLRRAGDAYLRKFGAAMPQSHRRALHDIRHCRTEVFGGHVYRCDHCEHRQYAYHSCKNRNCPKCQGDDTERWLAERRNELLDVPYFHLVFTLPEELRPIVRRHQKTLYGVLMKAAANSLMKLAADPRYVGGRIGVLAVLHTWTSPWCITRMHTVGSSGRRHEEDELGWQHAKTISYLSTRWQRSFVASSWRCKARCSLSRRLPGSGLHHEASRYLSVGSSSASAPPATLPVRARSRNSAASDPSKRFASHAATSDLTLPDGPRVLLSRPKYQSSPA